MLCFFSVKKVLEELQSTLTEKHLIVSIAAGVTLEQLQVGTSTSSAIRFPGRWSQPFNTRVHFVSCPDNKGLASEVHPSSA